MLGILLNQEPNFFYIINMLKSRASKQTAIKQQNNLCFKPKDKVHLITQKRNIIRFRENGYMLLSKLSQAYTKQRKAYFENTQKCYWGRFKYQNPFLYNKYLQADRIHQTQRKNNIVWALEIDHPKLSALSFRNLINIKT